MRVRALAIAAGAVVGIAFMGVGFAGDIPEVEPAAVGLSGDQLAALDARLQQEIDAGAFPGAMILVAREGQIAHLSTLGSLAPDGPDMPEDALFRIYSMTKPIVSAAAMTLVQEGRLALADPVSKFIPEFKEMTVATGEQDADGRAVVEPARRQMTVQDLLLHSSGIPYGFFGAGPAREAYVEAGIGSIDVDDLTQAKAIAGLPLEHHPGEVWEYGRSTDVLGAVIEVVTGQELGAALNERIFEPLGMVDTGFGGMPSAEHNRIAEPMDDDRTIGKLNMWDPRVARVYESGGGGLVSTMHDYSRFALMMLNGGEVDGEQILSPAMVRYMTSDHLGDRIKPGKYYLPGAGHGFGLGYAVRHDEGIAAFPGSEGTYFWGGAAGTFYFADPEQDLLMLYMMQSPKHRVRMRPILWNMVYGAIVEDLDD